VTRYGTGSSSDTHTAASPGIANAQASGRVADDFDDRLGEAGGVPDGHLVGLERLRDAVATADLDPAVGLPRGESLQIVGHNRVGAGRLGQVGVAGQPRETAGGRGGEGGSESSEDLATVHERRLVARREVSFPGTGDRRSPQARQSDGGVDPDHRRPLGGGGRPRVSPHEHVVEPSGRGRYPPAHGATGPLPAAGTAGHPDSLVRD
jgi:hypothetical protein